MEEIGQTLIQPDVTCHMLQGTFLPLVAEELQLVALDDCIAGDLGHAMGDPEDVAGDGGADDGADDGVDDQKTHDASMSMVPAVNPFPEDDLDI